MMLEICTCGHKRMSHGIVTSNCKMCKCQQYDWDRSMDKYVNDIEEALKNYSPEQTGGCFMATRFLIHRHEELKERTYKIKNIHHCVAELPDGRIIDTQLPQLSLIMKIPDSKLHKIIFTKREFEDIMSKAGV